MTRDEWIEALRLLVVWPDVTPVEARVGAFYDTHVAPLQARVATLGNNILDSPGPQGAL